MFKIIKHNSIFPFDFDQKIQCVVTSPPYWNLRDYQANSQIGNEETIEKYLDNLKKVFSNVYDILSDDGLLWIVIGDKYLDGQLQGIPWKLMDRLKKIGFFIRAENIWYKSNPLPESVKSRTTRAHEYVFMLSKSRRYFYDIDSIREPHTARKKDGAARYKQGIPGQHKHTFKTNYHEKGKNKNSVWKVSTTNSEKTSWHFAVFPEKLIFPCIAASTKENDWVFDPFSGSATTGAVALKLNRNYIGCEINELFINKSKERLNKNVDLFNH